MSSSTMSLGTAVLGQPTEWPGQPAVAVVIVDPACVSDDLDEGPGIVETLGAAESAEDRAEIIVVVPDGQPQPDAREAHRVLLRQLLEMRAELTRLRR